MNKALSATLVIGAAFIVGLSILFLVRVLPANAVGQAACPCQLEDPQKPNFCPYVACKDMTSGFGTWGHCVSPGICKGEGTGGPNGFGTDILKQVLGSLFQKLMQGSQNGSASPSPAAATPSCTPQQTADQTLAQSNPQCYYYVAPVSASLSTGVSNTNTTATNVSDQLLQALGASDNTNTNTNTNTNKSTNTSSNTASATTSVVTSVTQTPIVQLNPGISGDIKVLTTGGTILANNVDTGSNSAVAGFFGSDSFNGQPAGVVGQLCTNRPWASTFLSYVIPPAFFDSLCVLRGYEVGTPKPATATTVTVVQSAPKPIVSTTTVTATVPPKVAIWASPASVPLGARTSVFWTSQGVSQCTETSPDGNFNQSTVQGGASTAPITGSTIFTISCLAPDGSHITDNVTVNLAI